jgi:hypothetical protein
MDALKSTLQWEAMAMVSYIYPRDYMDLITSAAQVEAPRMMSQKKAILIPSNESERW